MTRGPRRLKDDPDFRWETGCNLADEESRVGEYDLPAIRNRLMAAAAVSAVPTPLGPSAPSLPPMRPPGRSRLKPAAGVVAGALVVAAAYWLGIQAGQGSAPPAPTVEPTEESRPLSPAPVDPTQVGTPVGTPDEAPAARTSATEAVRPRAATSIPSVAGDGTAAPVEPEAIVATVVPISAAAPGTADGDDLAASHPPPRSTLKEVQEAYDRADDALTNGRYADARAAFLAMEKRWPHEDYLGVELQMKLLQCDFGLGDDRATEAQAARIQDVPAFAAKRSEIARLRAQALVRLDRCDEAMVIAGLASPRDAAEIRRACREDRKETP